MQPNDRSFSSRAGDRARPGVDLFGSIPATVWTTDAALIVTFVDGVYLRRLGIKPEGVVGRTVASILLDGREDHPLIQAHLSALDGRSSTVAIEWGGKQFNVRLAPLRDHKDTIVGCVGVHLEMGETPDEDGTLRESDVRLRRVVDSNMIGIAFGDDTGRISDANDAFLQLTGYEREDLVSDSISWPALMPLSWHHLEAIDEILARGLCRPFETEILRKDGRRVPVLVGAARLSIRRREGVAFVLDITDRKRTAHRLKIELACADALAEARSADDGLNAVVNLLVSDVPLRSATVWSIPVDGAACRPAAGCAGDSSAASAALQPLAEAAVRSGEPQSSVPEEALVLPVPCGRGRAALVLTGSETAMPDAELVDSCRRIAQRIGNFLSKNG
jgi:PAS domain S-box-containing protein